MSWSWSHLKIDFKRSLGIGHLAEHKTSVHEGVKYLCGKCNFQATTKGSLTEHKKQCMKVSNIPAVNATIKQQHMEVLLNTEGQVQEGVRFQCRYCNQQYSSRANLTKHQKNLHL